jgi:hypothetical protein
LEKRYPDKILAFYRSGLDSLNQNAPRDTYARWAKRVAKVRHVWLDVLKQPDQWRAFAGRIKKANLRRPAFQQEFAEAIPGWDKL